MSLPEERTDSEAIGDYPASEPSMSSEPSKSSTRPAKRQEDIIVKDYFRKKDPLYEELDDLQEKIWQSPHADTYFRKQRKKADKPRNLKSQKFFYKMHKKIGTELQKATKAFSSPACSSTTMRALNLCMAPGGYTWSILRANPSAFISGITLPKESGGHAMLLPFGNEDSHVDVKYLDITMLAGEYGPPNANIPDAHPEASKFLADSPYQSSTFDIVVCDGQNLRTHKRAACRKDHEAFRLMVSQLIFGMNRIRPGGTLVILLHELGSWNSVKMLKTFASFSHIQLFKPRAFHGGRSSFYLIAKDVQPGLPEAIKSIEQWRFDWWQATFGGVESTGKTVEDDSETVTSVLESFGEKVMELGREIWSIQLDAMKEMPYI